MLLQPLILGRLGVISTQWVCRNCRSRQTLALRRLSSSVSTAATTTTPSKPYYITTPIFYVNAAPHIGHLHTMVLADVLKRWRLLQSPPRATDDPSCFSQSDPNHARWPAALLSTGTDEHGLKIQQAAERAGITPQALCDANTERFVTLAESAGVTHDFFARTTAPQHRLAVQRFWARLEEKGHIYKEIRAGWYSVTDECFYKDSEVGRSMHPRLGKLVYVAMATGSEVVWTEEDNYHFRLSAFKDRLLALYGVGNDTNNRIVVLPRERQNEVVSWIETNLSDLSISRPSSRIKWGIPVPGDDSQTVYVWVDALINYIVQVGYPDAPSFGSLTSSSSSPSPWPADVQVIGKDILRFHCVYWPALLMAADLPLPRLFLTHAHWTMGSRKMSKSLGNVVDPDGQLRRWGTDPVRYFLMAEAGAMADDKGYSNERVLMRYRELASKVGNVVNRIRPFGVADAVRTAMGGDSSQQKQQPPALIKMLEDMPGLVAAAMEQFQIPLAIQHVIQVMEECHRHIDEIRPWNRDPTDPAVARAVYLVAEASRLAAIALQPVMPTKMDALLDVLGVAADRRWWAYARIGGDDRFGEPFEGAGRDVLFPRIRDSEAALRDALRSEGREE